MINDRGMDRRGFLKLSAAISTPIALDGVVGRLVGEGRSFVGDDPDVATIVGPVPMASPVRGLRLSRERGPDGGGTAPDENEALQQFRRQVEAARRANVDAVIVPVARTEHREQAYENLLAAYASVAEVDAFVVRGAEDIGRAVEADRVGLIFQFQGMGMIGTDVPTIERWSAAGVSIMTLTHYWKTPYGYGAFARRDLGLSPRGEQAIRAMEKAGVVLDLSGVGARTARDALEVAEAPAVFSRSNAASVHDHALNIDDSLIQTCAEKGGVVGVSLFPPQLSSSRRPSADSIVDHIDYIADLVGPDHVALGLDLTDHSRKRFDSDPVPEPPFDYPTRLNGFDGLDGLRRRLSSRGYGSSQLGGMFGGNFARVFGEIRVASADRTGGRSAEFRLAART